MSESIKTFENSLKDYLINIQKDAYNKNQKIEHKYNNLKIYMDPTKVSTPHFFISYNISSACFQIDPVKVIDGSMGTDERYIILWANRPNIKGELKKHWLFVTNNLINILDEVDVELEQSGENSDYITGSGVKNKGRKN